MNKKRAILIAITLYLVTFIAGLIPAILARTNLASPQQSPTTYWLITIIITVLLTSLASIWYFSKKGIKRNIKEGFKLGATFIITGFIIDMLTLIPLFVTGEGFQFIKEYYTSPSFYIIILLIIISTTFVGSREPEKTNTTRQKKKK